MAPTAITVSNLGRSPSRLLSGELNIQQSTVAANIPSAIMRGRVHSIGSCSVEKRWFKFGRSTLNSTRSMTGRSIKDNGPAMRIQSAKLRLFCAAAMAFGGLPTKVAIPPILAQ